MAGGAGADARGLNLLQVSFAPMFAATTKTVGRILAASKPKLLLWRE